MLTITCAGRVGKDAVTKTVGNSTVTEFSLATQIGKDRETFWLNVSIWGKRGEALQPYLTKGTQATVIGDLTISQGDNKTFYTCRADQVALQGGPKEQRGDPYAA
ncbi:single-stranded DNA-binding protein [Ruegeria lacuscaerulensis]|uniref:single-stranded DNA-binding protein n=1 Tax=Ruegeria lacuscaerulensis TaxID=55218 RepID=UPI00147DF813|nr:single-stranded DNA-binding protein [Ruegeria lacuscaerulensis]